MLLTQYSERLTISSLTFYHSVTPLHVAFKTIIFIINLLQCYRERSGSVVECLTWDEGAAGSSLTGVTALCPWASHINPSLVLDQSRKTRPFITEKLLMGRKESNQTNKLTVLELSVHVFYITTRLIIHYTWVYYETCNFAQVSIAKEKHIFHYLFNIWNNNEILRWIILIWLTGRIH